MWGLLLPTYFIAFFHRTSLSTLADPLARALGLDEGVGTALGTLASVYFVVYAVLQLPSGVIADTIGARITVSVSSAIMGIGAAAFAMAPSLGIAIAARFLVGFGAAFNFIALLRQQVNWFDKRDFARLTALTVVTGNLGALFGIGPFALIVAAIGWRYAYLAPAIITLLFSLVVVVFVRNAPSGRETDRRESIIDGVKVVLGNPTNYLTCTAFGLSSGVYITFAGLWGVPFLSHVHGLTTLQASGCTTVLVFGMAVGCFVTPPVARLFGSPRNGGTAMLSVAGLLWGGVFFAPLPVDSRPLLYGLFLAMGVSIAGSVLAYATVRQANPEHAMGTAFAFTNTGGFVSIAALQYVVGHILDRFGGLPTPDGMPVYPAHAYHAAFGLLLALHCISAIAYAMVRELREEPASVSA